MDQVGVNLSLLLVAGDWGVCVLRPDRGLLTKHTLFLPSLWEEMGMAVPPARVFSPCLLIDQRYDED